MYDSWKSHQPFQIQHEFVSTSELHSKRLTWKCHSDQKLCFYRGEWRWVEAVIKPDIETIPRNPALVSGRRRLWPDGDLTETLRPAWSLRLAALCTCASGSSKISQKTLTTLSPPGTLHPPLCHLYCHPRQVHVHWLFITPFLSSHIIQRRAGRAEPRYAIQWLRRANSKGLKTLGRDVWRQWTTTRHANDNGRCWESHKQETSRGVQAIVHCGSTAGQFALPSFCNDNFPIDSAERNAPIPRLKVYLYNPSKCRGQGSVLPATCKMKRRQSFLSNEEKFVLLLFHLEDMSDNTVCVHYVNVSTMIYSRTQIIVETTMRHRDVSLVTVYLFSKQTSLPGNTPRNWGEPASQSLQSRYSSSCKEKELPFQDRGCCFFPLPQNLLFSRLACQAARVKLTLRDILRRSLIFNFEKQ